jgi:hypothetical protein
LSENIGHDDIRRSARHHAPRNLSGFDRIAITDTLPDLCHRRDDGRVSDGAGYAAP